MLTDGIYSGYLLEVYDVSNVVFPILSPITTHLIACIVLAPIIYNEKPHQLALDASCALMQSCN